MVLESKMLFSAGGSFMHQHGQYRSSAAGSDGSHLKFTSLNCTFIVVHNIKLVKGILCKRMNLVNLSKTGK